MVCRFYGYTLHEVEDLTIEQFMILNQNMVKITEIENPTSEKDKPKPLSSAMLNQYNAKPGKKPKKISQKPKRI